MEFYWFKKKKDLDVKNEFGGAIEDLNISVNDFECRKDPHYVREGIADFELS